MRGDTMLKATPEGCDHAMGVVESLSFLGARVSRMAADASRASTPEDWVALLNEVEYIRQVAVPRIAEHMEDARWLAKDKTGRPRESDRGEEGAHE